MREIKFRAWDKLSCKIREVAAINWVEGIVMLWKVTGSVRSTYYTELEDGVELMQYTGLKDKNGKEIYEGDILRFQFSEWCISPVYWTKERGWTVHGNITAWEYSIGSDFSKSNLEVIGNIYENPELLKEAQI